MAKGHITFDALNLMAKNNIKLISINYFGQINYILESPNQNNIVLKNYNIKLVKTIIDF